MWLVFNQQAGHQQTGKRPALVLSPKLYNTKTHLALVCPITNQIKGYPFEVILPSGLKVSGAILSDQIKSLDWKARTAQFIAKTPASVLSEVLGKAQTLLR